MDLPNMMSPSLAATNDQGCPTINSTTKSNVAGTPRFLQRLLSDEEQRIRSAARAARARDRRDATSSGSTMSSKSGFGAAATSSSYTAFPSLGAAPSGRMSSTGSSSLPYQPRGQSMQRLVGSQSSTSTSRPNFTHQQRSASAHSAGGYPTVCDVGAGSHLSSGSSTQWPYHAAASSTASSEDWRFMGYSSGDSLTSASASPKSAFYPSPAASPYSQSSYTAHHPNFHLHQHPLVLPPPSLEVPQSSSSTPSMLSPGLSTSLRSDYLPLTASSLTSTSTRTVSSEDDELTEAPEVDEALLQVPDNFAMVYPDVYRSSFPSKKHYPFLKNLGLKTVLTLVQEDYSIENRAFFKQNGTRLIQIGIPGNKEPFVCIPDERIREALSVVLDKRNHPLLIHCNKGKHRTGCLVGCLRKMQCWSNTAIFDEYRRFSFPKSRQMDQLFIELFQPDWNCVEAAQLPEWCIGEAGITSPVQRPPNPYMPPSEAPSESNSPTTEQPQCHSSICNV